MSHSIKLLVGFLLPGLCLAQNVVVNPAGNQNIVQPVNTQTSSNNFDNIRYLTPSDNWSQSGFVLTGGTSNTLTLTPCPIGVSVAGTGYYSVHIVQSGTSETDVVTGGTCTSGGSSGTIKFTTTNTYTSATIGSASSGIQEALNDAGSPNAHVVLAPTGANVNAYSVYATIYDQDQRSLLEGYGALLQCFTRSVCLFLGDRTSSNDFASMKVKGLRFTSQVNVDGVQVTSVNVSSGVVMMTAASHPFVVGDWVATHVIVPGQRNFDLFAHVTASTTNTFSFILSSATNFSNSSSFGTVALEATAIEDNGAADVMEDIDMSSVGNPGLFNNDIVVDNDQAALIHHFDTESGAQIRCDAGWCGWGVWARGDQGNSAVVTIDGGSNLSMACANGVNYRSGNLLTVRDTVIQAYSQHAVFQGSGLQGALYDNVYTEVGVCPNPLYPGSLISASGLTLQGQFATIRGGTTFAGVSPEFAITGSTQRNYFIVVHSSISSTYSVPLFAGYALSSGSGTITVYWPQMPATSSTFDGTITYDVLLGTSSSSVPTGTGIFGLATGISGSCSNGVCQFADTQAAASSYTVGNDPILYVQLNEWPGHIVVSTGGDTNNSLLPYVFSDMLPQNSLSTIVATSYSPAIFAQQCVSPLSFPSGIQPICNSTKAFQYQALVNGTPYPLGASGLPTNVKGSLIFSGTPNNPNHFITLYDSTPLTTLAAGGQRPASSTNDLFIGTDDTGSNARQISFGAPMAISNYIANIGDNSSWKTRLNSSGFAVATHLNQGSTGNFAGTCTFSAATTCTISYASSFTSTPVVILTPVNPGSITFKLTSTNNTGFTITASSSNSLTVNWEAIGNPN